MCLCLLRYPVQYKKTLLCPTSKIKRHFSRRPKINNPHEFNANRFCSARKNIHGTYTVHVYSISRKHIRKAEPRPLTCYAFQDAFSHTYFRFAMFTPLLS